ncbi:MAG: glycosyltransferase family 2 protein, partial [Paracoccaceae bacterium]
MGEFVSGERDLMQAVGSAKWGVVMTVDEPVALVLANIAWHLHTGAAEIHVYLSRPEDPLAATIADVPGCHVTHCTDAHWRAMGETDGRPALQTRRQSLNADHAYARSTADWLVHLDADEFLWQSRPLGEELFHLAAFSTEVTFSVRERVYPGLIAGTSVPDDIFAGAFRSAHKSRAGLDTLIYGDLEPFLIQGMLGHAAGKCAVPVGQDFLIGVHWAFRGKRDKHHRAPQFTSTSTRLLHFDGMTPKHWV